MNYIEAMEWSCHFARQSGAEQCDIIYSSSSSEELEVFEGKISKAEASSSLGLGLRLFSQQRPGYAYTQKLDKDCLRQMVVDAMAHCELADPVQIELPEKAPLPEIELGKWNDNLEKLSFLEMKEFCLTMESLARSGHREIVNVPHAGVSKGSSAMALMNSRGLLLESKSNMVSAYVGAVAQRGDQKKSGSFGNGGRDWLTLDPCKLASEAVVRATELLGAKSIPSGILPIVFSNRVSGSLLGMYMSSLSGEQVQKGQSRFAHQCGKTVASEVLSLSCKPHLVGQPGSRRFDSEGVLCKKSDLIINGTLLEFIHNLESAAKAGVTPTGHGSRGLRGRASVNFSNLVMAKGSSELSQLLDAHPRCLYVTKLDGGSACSGVSGELSIGAQGFLVEHGQLKQAVDAITINGNFFELIQNIQACSNAYQDVWSSSKFPDILVKKLSVSG